MHIALLSPRSDIHTVRWANALSERGHRIDLLSLHNDGGDPLHEKVSLHELMLPAPVGYYGNLIHIRKLLRELSPDILHAHYATGYGTLGRLSGYHPYMLSVWGSDVYEFPYRSFLHCRVLTKNLLAAEDLCSTSQAMADQTHEVARAKLPSIHVTPFGVDLDKFKPTDNPEGFSEKDTVVIGTVKKLEDKYGVDILLRSFARSRKLMQTRGDERSLRLLIVGDGPNRESLEELSQHLGVCDVTTFVGAVPHSEVPNYLAKLDIYVAASRYESFGVAIIEASACGKPVIVSDVGGLPEVVRHRETGFVFPEDEVDSFARAMEMLVKNPEKRKEMGENGRSYVAARYSWPACVDQMECVYESLISRG